MGNAMCCDGVGSSKPAGTTSHDARLPACEAVRIMTYNIHHCEDGDGVVSAEAIARVVNEQQPDLVALQEVDRNADRTGRVDFVAEFERLTGMTSAFGPNIDNLDEPQLLGAAGQYGNLLLTKLPLLSHVNTPLTQIEPGGETRGLQVATVQLKSGKELTVANTHLDHRSPEERLHSCPQLQECLSGRGGLTVLCGDFNAGPDKAEIVELTSWLQDAWVSGGGAGDGLTNYMWEDSAPDERIDYIWHGDGLRVRKVWVPDSGKRESDHLPVVADVEVI